MIKINLSIVLSLKSIQKLTVFIPKIDYSEINESGTLNKQHLSLSPSKPNDHIEKLSGQPNSKFHDFEKLTLGKISKRF